MKSAICTVAFALAFVLAVLPATAATKVFFLGGQSNMAGCGKSADLVGSLAKYSGTQTAVNYWNGASWVALRPGYGDNSGYFGPEVSFGYAMHNAFPTDDIYLVKYGISGSILADNGSIAAGTWAPDATTTTPHCYPAFKSTAQAALATLAGKNPVVAGMLWMQGESDAYFDDTAAAYKTNLKSFIARVRTDFNAPNMEFVIAQITTSYGGATDNGLVRAAQAAVPGEVAKTAWFPTQDLSGWQTGGGHYDAQGQIDIGLRYANVFVPEPSTSALLVTGLFGLLCYARPQISRLFHKC